MSSKSGYQGTRKVAIILVPAWSDGGLDQGNSEVG